MFYFFFYKKNILIKLLEGEILMDIINGFLKVLGSNLGDKKT